MAVRTDTRAFAAAVFALAATCALAADIRVEAQSDRTDLYLGESFIYQITVHNAKSPPAPVLDGFDDGFAVTRGQDQPINSMSMTWINGNLTKHEVFGHVFTYQLTPKRAGQIAVPSPKVTVGGQTYLGNPLAIRVVAPERQDFVLAELSAAPAKVYPTQPFAVTLRIWMKPLPGRDAREPVKLVRPPSLSIPWLREPPAGAALKGDVRQLLTQMLAPDRRGFALEGFSAGNDMFAMFEQRTAIVCPPARRETRKGDDGREQEYFLYELRAEYRAEKPGALVFGPVTIKGQFIVGADARNYLVRPLFVATAPVTVESRDLMAQQRPADFTGGIGRFDLRAKAEPTAAKVGDPITVQLDVVPGPGSGSLDLVAPPNLARQEDVAADFTVVDEQPIGEVTPDGVKRFKYAVRPKRAGVSLPAITMSYFDPAAEEFRQAKSAPITLQITEASRESVTAVVSASRAEPASASGVRQRAGGIHQNMTDLNALGDERPALAPHLIALAVLAVAYTALWSVVAWRRRAVGDVAGQRRARALKTALHALRTESGAPDAIRAALLGLVADLLNLNAASLTTRDADAALERSGASAEARQTLARVLGHLESLAYGGGAGGDVQTLIQEAQAVAQRLDHEVRR